MKRIDPALLPADIVEEQYKFMQEVKALTKRPKTYCVVTYGCQMNVHDSEKIAGMLSQMGLTACEEREKADFVIFNTCCIRENAQRRALGNVVWLKMLKKKRPELMVAVCGCMVQQKGMAEQILRQYPFVDLAFGTHNLHRLPELFLRAVSVRKRVVEVIDDDEGHIAEDVPIKRTSPFHAYITIMYGCNNFCSFCIVPYVRGRERSRGSAAILSEVTELYAQGVKEIMLLGQNVNSYGNDLDDELSFPQLLAALDQIGIERIRFMTSHPKDLSDELIEVMAESKHICPAFHLPIQSGNDRILVSMNRHYTRDQYLDRVQKLRARIPDISLTTDLIVAYPSETEEEFADTCALVEQVGFDAAFTFVYSPRIGTRAAAMAEQIPSDIASDRIQRLLTIQRHQTAKRCSEMVGRTKTVLVESISKRDENNVSGKDEHGMTVNFPGNTDLIGQLVKVKITSAGDSSLRAEMI